MQTLSPYIISEPSESGDGPSLQAVVRERGPLPGPRLRRVALRTAGALAAMHRAGIVHGGLGPSSVLLGPGGAKVAGLGGGATAGLPAFLAPEQIEEEPVGPPADVFSWAATMVYAATGRPPFGSGPSAAVTRRVTSRPPELGDLQEPLRELVILCLDKNPSARPTAPQLVRALRDGRMPTPKPRPHGIPPYRSRMMIALGVAITLGFTFGVLLPG